MLNDAIKLINIDVSYAHKRIVSILGRCWSVFDTSAPTSAPALESQKPLLLTAEGLSYDDRPGANPFAPRGHDISLGKAS